MDLQEIFERARDAFSARIVVGEAVERGAVTVVPVVRVRGGGGGGAGGDGSGGGGFGLNARPVGAWVIRRDDVRWEPAVDVTQIALAAIGLLALALLRIRRPT